MRRKIATKRGGRGGLERENKNGGRGVKPDQSDHKNEIKVEGRKCKSWSYGQKK